MVRRGRGRQMNSDRKGQLGVPAACQGVSATDLLTQVYVLPH